MAKNFNDINDEDYKDCSFEANGKTINYRKAVVNPIDQSFLNLNEKDKEFFNYSLGDADSLLRSLPDGDKSLANYAASDLDELLYLWNNKRQFFKFTEETHFVNAIGSAFGNSLNKELNTVWSVISDEYGTDYACIGTGGYTFQLFPFSSVWKAIKQNREDSLEAIVEVVKKTKENWKKQ